MPQISSDQFGFFIVLPMHKESLRDMIDNGMVNKDVKINVLKMLKPLFNRMFFTVVSHGDIKDTFDKFVRFATCLRRPQR